MNQLLALILLCCSSCVIWAQHLPRTQPVPGGIELLHVNSIKKPEAYFNDKRLAVFKGDKPHEWVILVGVPLETKIGKQKVTLKNDEIKNISFNIRHKNYRIQRIKIKNKRKVTPNPQDIAQIEQEKKQVNAVLEVFSQQAPFEQQLSPPIKGYISSQFGLRRIYNDKPRNPHSGLDIAAAQGTPVHAITQGKVVATDALFFTGNTVIIDHGKGIFSIYAHLSKIDVKNNQQVKRGQVLGKVGQTGRATGPHLHWEMIVNQTRVNPLLFVPYSQIKPKPKPKKENIANNG